MIQDEVAQRTALAIDLDTENGLMRIAWADGHESYYELAALRRYCPCAGCAGEMGRPGSVTDKTVFSTAQTSLYQVEPLNRFGLRFEWADGHNDGLYSYAYLRSLCPCAQCAAAYRNL